MWICSSFCACKKLRLWWCGLCTAAAHKSHTAILCGFGYLGCMGYCECMMSGIRHWFRRRRAKVLHDRRLHRWHKFLAKHQLSKSCCYAGSIFAYGCSNGGLFVHQLARQLPNFKAIAAACGGKPHQGYSSQLTRFILDLESYEKKCKWSTPCIALIKMICPSYENRFGWGDRNWQPIFAVAI